MATRKDGKESRSQRHKKNRKKHIEQLVAPERDPDAPKCSATSRKNEPCGMPPLKKRASTNGKPYCIAHHPDVSDEEKYRHRSMGGKANASRYPKPHELLRRIVEARPDAFIRPHLEALGLEVEFKDSDDPERAGQVDIEVHEVGDGAVLFGVSKDGDVVISGHKDLEAQQRAAERLFDRVYGKPKQADKVHGSHDEPDPPAIIPYDEQRQSEVAEILASTGVQASAPPPPADMVGNGSRNGHTNEEER
jgi:hypothetical protein